MQLTTAHPDLDEGKETALKKKKKNVVCSQKSDIYFLLWFPNTVVDIQAIIKLILVGQGNLFLLHQ